jgi:hypothetical protein
LGFLSRLEEQPFPYLSTLQKEQPNGDRAKCEGTSIFPSLLIRASVILRFAKDLKLANEEEISRLEKKRNQAGRLTWKLYEAIRKAAE